jgi:hypothetical protein
MNSRDCLDNIKSEDAVKAAWAAPKINKLDIKRTLLGSESGVDGALRTS